jgi:hypothetical protein
MSTVQLNDGVEIPILGLKVVMNAPSTDAIKGAYSEVHIRHINLTKRRIHFGGAVRKIEIWRHWMIWASNGRRFS